MPCKKHGARERSEMKPEHEEPGFCIKGWRLHLESRHHAAMYAWQSWTSHAFTVCVYCQKDSTQVFLFFAVHEMCVLVDLNGGQQHHRLNKYAAEAQVSPPHCIRLRPRARSGSGFGHVCDVYGVFPVCDRPGGNDSDSIHCDVLGGLHVDVHGGPHVVSGRKKPAESYQCTRYTHGVHDHSVCRVRSRRALHIRWHEGPSLWR